MKCLVLAFHVTIVENYFESGHPTWGLPISVVRKAAVGPKQLSFRITAPIASTALLVTSIHVANVETRKWPTARTSKMILWSWPPQSSSIEVLDPVSR